MKAKLRTACGATTEMEIDLIHKSIVIPIALDANRTFELFRKMGGFYEYRETKTVQHKSTFSGELTEIGRTEFGTG